MRFNPKDKKVVVKRSVFLEHFSADMSADVSEDGRFWATNSTCIFIKLEFYDSIKRESIFLRKNGFSISESGADHNCLITQTG